MYVHLACPHLLLGWDKLQDYLGKSDNFFAAGNDGKSCRFVQPIRVAPMTFIVPFSWEYIIIPTDDIIFFRGVGIPPTILWLWPHEWVVNGWFHLFSVPQLLPIHGCQAKNSELELRHLARLLCPKKQDLLNGENDMTWDHYGSMDVFWG